MNMKKILSITAIMVLFTIVSLYVKGTLAGPRLEDMESLMAISSDGIVYMAQEKGRELWIYGFEDNTLVYTCQITDSGSDFKNRMKAINCQGDILYGLIEQCSRISGEPFSWQIIQIGRENGETKVTASLNQNMLSEAYDLKAEQDKLYVTGLSKDQSQVLVYQADAREAMADVELAMVCTLPEHTKAEKGAFGQGNLFLLLDNGYINICTSKNQVSLFHTDGRSGFFVHSPQAVWYYNPDMDQMTRLSAALDTSLSIPPEIKLETAVMAGSDQLSALAIREGGSRVLAFSSQGQWKVKQSLGMKPGLVYYFALPYMLPTILAVLAIGILAGMIWWAYGRNGRISLKLSALCLMISLILAGGWYCFLKASQAIIGAQLPLIRMSLAIFAVMLFAFYLQVDYITRPLRSLPRFMDKLTEGNYKVEKKFLSNDEVGYAWSALNRMAAELESKRYQSRELLTSYYRFVPRDMHTLFGKKGITELKAGDMKEMSGMVGLIAVQNRYEIRKQASDGEYAVVIKEIYQLVDEVCTQYGGIIAGNDFNLSGIHILFHKDTDVAAFGRELAGNCRSQNEGLPNPVKLLFMVHKTSYLYGLGGIKERAFPCFISSEAEILLDFFYRMKETGVQFAVTEQVFREREAQADGRYLGFISSRDGSFCCKLYEILDGCTNAQKTLKQHTDEKLQKGIELFYKNDFYLARNLFSAVVKENKEDGIARWYLFASEYYFDLGDAQNVNYSLLSDIGQGNRAGGENE